MSKILFIVTFLAGLQYCSLNHPPTSGVKQRVEVLKWQLRDQIMEQLPLGATPPPDDDITIVPKKNALRERFHFTLMTPVTRLRRKKTRTTARTTKETTTENIMVLRGDSNVTDSAENLKENLEIIQVEGKEERAKKWANHLNKYESRAEPFYRRGSKQVKNEAEINKRHQFFCVDLLRPVLMGFKKNFTKQVVFSDYTVLRLIQLLSYHGPEQTADEIRAILLQINNLQIRFFQWRVDSIKMLFNFLMPSKSHSFKSLKYGIKKILLTIWKMDLSNTKQLIRESRMFRPPCIGVSHGSTMSSRAQRYTSPAKPKSTCPPKDKKCLQYAAGTDNDDNDDDDKE